jgi:hypothetical protein
LQHEQRREVKEIAQRLNPAPHENDEHCEQRETFIHRLEQVVDEERPYNVERNRDQRGREP